MNVHRLNSFYFTKTLENHNYHKNIILKHIEKIPKNKHFDITHTDWNLTKNSNKEYFNYLFNYIKEYMKEISYFLNTEKWDITNAWFQQYYFNDTHNWHTHAYANFTNVYFLELPDKEYKTDIYDNMENRIINLDVKEGDIITFPAFYSHRSKTNLSDKRKTIISFNSNFFINDEKKINTKLLQTVASS